VEVPDGWHDPPIAIVAAGPVLGLGASAALIIQV